MTGSRPGACPLSHPSLATARNQAIAAHMRRVDERNARFFDEEVLKPDHWSDVLKQGLEREIKEIDRQTREARKTAALAATLAEKLEIQRAMKALASTRKRRDLFDAQDEIDKRRDELIGQGEARLARKEVVTPLFTVRWSVV